MTLEEAIKHAEEKAAELREYSDVLSETSTTPKGKEISDCLECAEEHEQLAEWLKELKALKERPQGEWIPVSERLPEMGESVLVCIKTQGGISQYVSERFHDNQWSALGGRTPIAWRPLPEPYKKGGAE